MESILENKETEKLHLFHGGCHGCTQQKEHGPEFCVKCQYFDANWELPNLNNRPPTETELLKKRIKEKYRNTPVEWYELYGSPDDLFPSEIENAKKVKPIKIRKLKAPNFLKSFLFWKWFSLSCAVGYFLYNLVIF